MSLLGVGAQHREPPRRAQAYNVVMCTMLYITRYEIRVMYAMMAVEVSEMGYSIVHVEKVKGGALRGIENHMMRLRESRSNPDIIAERTPENLTIISGEKLSSKVKARIAQLKLKRKPRSDATYLVDFIAGASPEDLKSWSREQQDRYFQETVDFVARRYGRENLMYAVVHRDEATPHLHLGIVPVTKDGRLSARDLFTPQELAKLHTDYHAAVGAKYGLERGEQGGKKKHLDTMRFKLSQTAQEASEAQNRLDSACEREKRVTERLERLKEQGKTVSSSADEMLAIKQASTNLIFGRFVNNDDFARMRYLAQEASAASMARDEEKERAEKAAADAADADERARKAEERAKKAEQERVRALDAVDWARAKGREEGRAQERGRYDKEDWDVLDALRSLRQYDGDVWAQGADGSKISIVDYARERVMREIDGLDSQAADMQRSRGARSR